MSRRPADQLDRIAARFREWARAHPGFVVEEQLLLPPGEAPFRYLNLSLIGTSERCRDESLALFDLSVEVAGMLVLNVYERDLFRSDTCRLSLQIAGEAWPKGNANG